MPQPNQPPSTIIGIDLGDQYSYLHKLNPNTGATISQTRIATTTEAFSQYFQSHLPARIAIEAGLHSPWVNQLLTDHGHHVFVANPSAIPLIHASHRKSDTVDAEKLARLSPLEFKHINFLGRYHFELPEQLKHGHFRPFRDSEAVQ